MATITARDFYKLVIDATRDSDAEDYQQMFDYAVQAIEKLDARNEKRKATPSKASKEAADRKVAVLNVLSFETLMNRTEVAAEVGCTEGQATAALTALVRDGLVQKFEAKGKGGKTTYSRVLVED